MISVNQVNEILQEILDISEKELNIVPSFFEITTMMALEHFSRSNVDVVVLETGLGGRLDCTNIVKKPILTGITNIGLDHVRVLGSTIEEIAKEKAGIIKEDVDLVLGPRIDSIASKVIHDHAYKTIRSGNLIVSSDCNVQKSSLPYDFENNCMAHTMLNTLKTTKGFSKLNESKIQQGLETRPWCRFNTTRTQDGIDIVVDAAHNEMGMKALMKGLVQEYPNRTFRFVIGLSEDKEAKQMMNEISIEVVSALHLTKSNHRRATEIQDLIRDVPSSLLRSRVVENYSSSVENTVLHAIQSAQMNNEVVVICGSLYMMSEVSNVLTGFPWSSEAALVDEVVKGVAAL
jgi:dihydrofolate synthase / folylpolyglutamate synthase